MKCKKSYIYFILEPGLVFQFLQRSPGDFNDNHLGGFLLVSQLFISSQKNYTPQNPGVLPVVACPAGALNRETTKQHNREEAQWSQWEIRKKNN